MQTKAIRKIVISDQVYMNLSEEEQTQQVELLTFMLPKSTPTQRFQPIQIQIKCISKQKGIYSFPVGHLNTVMGICERLTGAFIPEFIDKTSAPTQAIPKPKFTLRESQQWALDKYVNHESYAGLQKLGIVNAIPG